MRLQTIIGLEIHVQLKTASKMFCGCARVTDETPPNTSICPVCVGHPGTLPVPNAEAVRLGIAVGQALEGTIGTATKFDRKNYFYPDLPKGYQISQFDQPLILGGALSVEVPDNSIATRQIVRVRFVRLHLEEDAAKLTHASGGSDSFVDFNRAGTPLLEMVTEPDLRSAEEARAFLQELRRVLRELKVSDADMEKGNLRCDVNISLRPADENGQPLNETLYPKTEIKNVNSFRSVERAILFEIDRQSDLWQMNTPPQIGSTRGWNDDRGITELQRTKEEAHDYRYFPEPDIPRLQIQTLAEEQLHRQTELPAAKRERFRREYSLSEQDARTLIEDRDLADYFEAAISETRSWAQTVSLKISDEKLMKLASGWLISKLSGFLKAQNFSWADRRVTPENFGEFIKIVAQEEVSGPNALKLLEAMVATAADPSDLMEKYALGRIADAEVLLPYVRDVIKMNPKQVREWQAGKEPVLKFLIGLVMKATEGKADPRLTEDLLRQESRQS